MIYRFWRALGFVASGLAAMAQDRVLGVALLIYPVIEFTVAFVWGDAPSPIPIEKPKRDQQAAASDVAHVPPLPGEPDASVGYIIR